MAPALDNINIKYNIKTSYRYKYTYWLKMVGLAIRDSAHHFVSHSSQGAGLCCECVFLHLIKEPGFVTHRILRSKSNTYYMNTTAGYFPTSPDIFVYKHQKKKEKEIREPTERSHVVWFVMLLDERRVCLSGGLI